MKLPFMVDCCVCKLKFCKKNRGLFDDDDINREIRNTLVRTNVLLRRFGNNRSVAVKRMLFKS